MAKETQIQIRCSHEFKKQVEVLAKNDNRNISNYIESLIKRENKKLGETKMTIEKIINNLLGMEVTEDVENEICCAFEDYEYEGETKIIVSKDESNANIDYQACVDHEDAPIICIKIEKNRIVSVYEYNN